MDRILTKELLVKRRVDNRDGILSGVYHGKIGKDGSDIFAAKGVSDVVTNSKGVQMQSVVVAKEGRWVNSGSYWELWNRIEDAHTKLKNTRVQNVSQFPDDYYDLIDMIRLDLTRRRIEQVDFTDQLAQEIVNPSFSRSVRLDEFLPYSGAFEVMKGTGDSVPLIQQKTGETGSVSMAILGLGHERTIEDELYNMDIFDLQKVNKAVTRAHTAARNDLTIGQLVANTIAGTWDPAQQVPASLNASYDLALYETIRNALRHLMLLVDPQTEQEIDASRIALVVRNKVIAWDLNRVLNGNLASSKSGAGTTNAVINVEPLAVDEIWMYKGDTLYVGPKKHFYPGVPDGIAYLVVTAAGGDNANYVLTKRGLTMEMGRGSVLELSREQRAWYFAQTQYNNEFFGGTGGLASGTGYCVEITLPSFNENT